LLKSGVSQAKLAVGHSVTKSVFQPSVTALRLHPSPSGILQRKCACGGAAGVSGECEECSKKKQLGLQAKLQISEAGDIYEREADWVADKVMSASTHSGVTGSPPRIQRLAGQSIGQTEAPASVDQVLASPGRPLEPELRQDMEQRIGYDFSRVRLHSGPVAKQSAQDLNAHAYTVGPDVVFGAGRFAPGTHEGRRLIAHELTHVVQQSGADRTYSGQDNEKRGLPPNRLFGYSPIRLRHTLQATIQRQADFGLATSQSVSGYAAKVKAYKSDRANQRKSFEDLARYAVGVSNDELQAMGIPPMKLEIKPLSSAAQFWSKGWEMTVDRTRFTGRSGPLAIGQLTKQQMTDLVENIYHEARHAEQHYKVAQLLGGQRKSEAEIAREADVPENIAKRARAEPLIEISPPDETIAIYVREGIAEFLGHDPKDIAKSTEDYRKRVAERNGQVPQVQEWHREGPLTHLIYDRDYKIRGALHTVKEEAEKRRRMGSWDTSKLQPAVDVVRNEVVPRLDTEINRVSAQTRRSQMVAHLVSLKGSLTAMIDVVQQQTNSQTLIPEFPLIKVNADVVSKELKVAYDALLIEADAYTQARKVTAAMRRQ
jgi:hypothetical protein